MFSLISSIKKHANSKGDLTNLSLIDVNTIGETRVIEYRVCVNRAV